jgi:hypothetical protein
MGSQFGCRGHAAATAYQEHCQRRTTPNPADWSLLNMPKHGLVAKKVKTQNHPAMPAVDVPKFWK